MSIEKSLIEELAGTKGGMARLDRIAEKLRSERAAVTQRQRELDELLELTLQLRRKPPTETVDSATE